MKYKIFIANIIKNFKRILVPCNRYKCIEYRIVAITKPKCYFSVLKRVVWSIITYARTERRKLHPAKMKSVANG